MIQKVNLYSMISEANDTATKKGWHEPEPSFSDYIALMNSELGEAVQELRTNPNPTAWVVHVTGKPEGFPVELADVCIRIMDFVGQVGQKVKKAELVVVTAHQTACNKALEIETAPDPSGIICVMGEFLFRAWRLMTEQEIEGCLASFGMVIGVADAWCIRNGLSLEDVIREKMNYNKTRPYRHGGKLL